MKRTSIISGLAAALLALLSLSLPSAPANAQAKGGNASVTSTSPTAANVNLTVSLQNFPSALIIPDPSVTAPVYWEIGSTNAVAATAGSAVLPQGGICINVGPNGWLSVLASTGSAKVNITQLTTCPYFARGGGSGGGGSGVSSFNTRTGAVVPATNDYNFNQIAGNYTLAQGPTIGAGTVLGSVAGGTPQALTQTQLTALVNTATVSLPGALPAWPGNTTTYFRGDGTYATLNQAAVAGLTTASSPAFAGVTIGAGSAITGSGPGGPLTAVAYSSFGTASGNAAQGGVITAGGPTGSATVAPIITYNAAGQLTAVTSATITPAVGSITGLGSNVATALGNTAGGTGGFALVSAANVASVSNSDGTLTISPTTGAVVASIALGHANTWSGQQTFVAPILGTPASGVATNLTGTASGLTAGNVTTNANLTGDVTSSGNATTLVTAQTGAHSWSALQTYSAGETNSTNGAASAPSKIFTGTLFTGGSGTTTFPQMLFQPTGTAAVTTWATTGTVIGINAAAGTGSFIDFHLAGAGSVFNVATNGNLTAAGLTSTGSIVNGAAGIFQWNGRGILTSSAAGGVQVGNADAASPIAQTVSFQSATGTNTAAATQATIQGPLATGTATNGDIVIKTGVKTTTGAVQGTPTTAMTIKGETQQINTVAPIKISNGYTVATLPTAGTAGRYAYITDQLTTCAAAGAALVGGGAVTCPVFDNGTAWVGGWMFFLCFAGVRRRRPVNDNLRAELRDLQRRVAR